MKTRQIPNLVTSTRILLCIGIIFAAIFGEVWSWYTMTMFIVAGVSDMIDGPLARRIPNAASEFGATLDSLADVIMIGTGIGVLMTAMDIWGWLVFAISGVLVLKVLVSTGIGFIRFKEAISLHTISFKILVIFMFTIPLVYWIWGANLFVNIYTLVIISAALLFVIEEIVIVSALKKPSRNIKSVFQVRSENRRFSEGDKMAG